MFLNELDLFKEQEKRLLWPHCSNCEIHFLVRNLYILTL